MSLPRGPFCFLRHGETDYNARGLSQGAVDIDLNARGRAQAETAAPLLAGKGLVGIVCSPMKRTRQTAEIVNRALGLPITFEPGIREVIFGGMEGKPLEPWFGEWLAGRHTPPGAESFAEITARIEATLTRVLAAPGPLLLVSHGGAFRALRGILGLVADQHTPNGVPLWCRPEGAGWRVDQD